MEKNGYSVKEKVDHGILNDSLLTKDQIREGVARDIASLALILNDWRSKDVVDAIAEVFWQRYLQHLERKRKESEEALRKEAQGYAE